MPAGGRDLIKPEYVELCVKFGTRLKIANNTPYGGNAFIHKHTYYGLTVLSMPDSKPRTVIFSYWKSNEKKVIDQCIERFDKRLRLDEKKRLRLDEEKKKRRAKQVKSRVSRGAKSCLLYTSPSPRDS